MAACRLQAEQQLQWVADITDMMEEGPRVILRLSKIRRAIICHPEPMLSFSAIRTELEMLHLEQMIRSMNGLVDRSDVILKKILRRQTDIMENVTLLMFYEGSYIDFDNPNYIYNRILM